MVHKGKATFKWASETHYGKGVHWLKEFPITREQIRKSHEFINRACDGCKSDIMWKKGEYSNCRDCYDLSFCNIMGNFRPLDHLCSFCKGLMERFYQCAPRIPVHPVPQYLYDPNPKYLYEIVL